MAERRPAGYPKLKNYKPSKFMLPTSHYDIAVCIELLLLFMRINVPTRCFRLSFVLALQLKVMLSVQVLPRHIPSMQKAESLFHRQML